MICLRLFGPRLLSASIGLGTIVTALPGHAGVTSSTEMRDYRVSGTTMASLVAYMKSNPFPGDEGPALANIRQSYALSVNTKEEGGVCRAGSVDVNIHFVMTLPKAVDAQALVGNTRVAWYNFVAFARHHEETRRSIFLQCGKDFVARAMHVTSKSGCSSLEANIRNMFEAAKQACDRKQLAYGRADDPRVRHLTLFVAARGSSHRLQKPKG
jgi:predicted secreted Zn-dependent protease